MKRSYKIEKIYIISGIHISCSGQYTVRSRDQNAERNHNIKIDISSFERVELFQYLGKT